MSIITWRNPLSTRNEKYPNPFQSLQQELDKSMQDFYRMMESPYLPTKEIDNFLINPSVDIIEDDNSFKVEAEMPGMGEENIKVSINNQILSIRGERQTSKKDKGKNYIMREIGYGSYERNIPLPDDVDTDKAKASFKKGMLWVNFPKKAGSERKHRELKIEKAITE